MRASLITRRRVSALSVSTGRVAIDWRTLDGGGLEIVWVERGGPQVAQPQHRGFGTLVIERNLQRALDAEVGLSFDPEGLSCRMKIPASNLVARL